MADTVIREVTKDLWTFSRPFTLFDWISIGGRSTAIKLADGSVWVLASTPLTEETKDTLDKLGPVKYIVSPNGVHWMFLGEYKEAYPDAKLLGTQMAANKSKSKGWKFDGILGADPEGTNYGFEDEIRFRHFPGHKNSDVAFFHVSSKTMITADLVFNFPPAEQYSKTAPPMWIPILGSMNPSSWVHRFMAGRNAIDPAIMKQDVNAVASEWDFERIIPCHGDVIETSGKQAWQTAYKSFFS